MMVIAVLLIDAALIVLCFVRALPMTLLWIGAITLMTSCWYFALRLDLRPIRGIATAGFLLFSARLGAGLVFGFGVLSPVLMFVAVICMLWAATAGSLPKGASK